MSYDTPAFASLVVKRLAEFPHITLVVLSLELQIDRHTLNRALVESTGLTFRQLKNLKHSEVIQALFCHASPGSIKQAAVEAGYGSGASLARRTRRTMGMTPSEIRRIGRR